MKSQNDDAHVVYLLKVGDIIVFQSVEEYGAKWEILSVSGEEALGKYLSGPAGAHWRRGDVTDLWHPGDSRYWRYDDEFAQWVKEVRDETAQNEKADAALQEL